MNKAILMGRLIKDPEVRYSQSAEPVAIARYTLAVNKNYKREGEPDADFINIVTIGKGAEFVERYFKKGMMVTVSGRIQTRTWDDQNNVRHYFTEVLTEEQEFAESKASFESRANNASMYPPDAMYANVPQQKSSKPQNPAAPRNPSPQANNGSAFDDGGFSAITESIDDDDLPF